ncbi:hypothetical protein [Dyadobacter psychrophilus]|uniref:Uncharacterized protein n=1 Tax=Dyadobacter psychrophilus TaxID=651661 RepID=A0A1T5E0D0_9BACT|nr:hypothetical protein [Dyadobacter psychrophilus]SKB77220.1 hypothetical protein SAMN05660293_02044 [Dyadobacter psychrophilus]
MITFHNLLLGHRDRTNAVIGKYVDKYKTSGDAITVMIWNTFVLENARDVIAELTQSGAEVFHQAIINKIKLESRDYEAIREVNLDAASKYQQELKALFDRIS